MSTTESAKTGFSLTIIATIAILVIVAAGFTWWGLEGRTNNAEEAPTSVESIDTEAIDPGSVPFTTCGEGCTHQ